MLPVRKVDHPIYGTVMVFDDRDTISRCVASGREWEPEIADILRKQVKPGTDVLDIGANLGFSALGLVARGGGEVAHTIHCFEPQTAVHAMLQQNVNGHPNIKTYSFALSGKSVGAHSYKQDPTNVGGTAMANAGTDTRHFVLSTSLDELSLLGMFPRPVSLLKIDVECHELELFSGAHEFFRRHRPAIVIEIWSALAGQFASVERALGDLGYALAQRLGGDDYLFSPQESRAVSVPSSAPLLGLVMVVKNEAHGIASTLMSLREHIDTWTILDTGSTDGTQDIIREVLSGEFTVPGNLLEEPFVDFSTTYNRALDLHGTSSQFILHILGDEILTDGAALRAFCKLNPTGRLFYVPMRQGEVDYKLPRLSRPGAGKYVGRTHEYFSGAVAGTAPGKITRGVAPDEAARKRRRWELDREILEADLAKNPTTDVRSAFYLAQTYECLGMKAEAIEMYARRTVMQGAWHEETFEAQRRLAALQADRAAAPGGDTWPVAQQAYLDAFALDPKRAEPLYAIAKHWYDKEKHALVCLFAEKALAIPKPDTAMFVDHEIYDWKIADLLAISSFYAGDKAVGAKAAEAAVRARPGDERMRNNRAFYAKSAREAYPSYHSQEIELPQGFLEPGWFAMNPSIYRALCVIRTVNYDITQNYKTCDGGPIQTRNYMAELGFSREVTRLVEITESPEVAATLALRVSAFPVHGYEDCRLFGVDGDLYCTATVCDFDLTGQGKREIVLLALAGADENYQIKSVTPLRGSWSNRHQKNWVPMSRDGTVDLLYGVVRNGTSPDLYSAEYLTLSSARGGLIDDHGMTSFDPGRLRGGSQGVWIDNWNGWLYLAHDVTFSGNARTYLHRWVFVDKSIERNGPVTMSEPFFFERRGIEFAAGLVLRGAQLVASFAVGDQKPYFGTFALADVLASLKNGLTP